MMKLLTCVVTLLVVPALVRADENVPPMFDQKVTLDEGIARTQNSNKIFVVKATASWCAPCKRMDHTTWRDERVVAWFKEFGSAMQLDVDVHPEWSQRLKIRAMPTMVAFKGGIEFDRLVGYKTADELLEWGDDVRTGIRRIDRLGADIGAGEKGDVHQRLKLARALLETGDYERATTEFLWLWKNILKHEPSMVGVRGSFMARDMERLVKKWPDAHKALARERDETETRIGKDPRALSDWIVLNKVLGAQARTLGWVDARLKAPDGAAALARHGYLIDDLLIQNDRWKALAIIWPDPAARIDDLSFWLDSSMVENMAVDDPQLIEQLRASNRRMFITGVDKLFTVYIGAAKPAEAQRTLDLAKKHMAGPVVPMSAIRMAISKDQADPMMIRVLDHLVGSPGLETDDWAKLRASVERALMARGGV